VVDIGILYHIGMMVLVAALVALGARAIRVPTIVAYIIAGLLIGPATGYLVVTHPVEVISEVGIALLLFLVGLELSLDKIRDVGKVAVLAGIGQVVFTAAGGLGIALLLGFTLVESAFISVALTFSSTVVVVKLLDEKKEINELYGRIAVGIFLIQDLVVIIALTFVAGLVSPEEITAASVAGGIAWAFGGMILLLAAALLASRYVLPALFSYVAVTPEARMIWSLCWCFLLVMGAEIMGLSVEIGAFLAGISLAQLPYNHDLRRRVHPLVNFFIAIFFITLGVQMDLSAAVSQLGPALVLSLFVLIGNPFIFMWIIARMGYSERTSFLTSVTVAQISEFSFIFAAMGLAAGLINEAILSLVAVVGLVTIAASSYMIIYNHQLYRMVRDLGVLKMFRASNEEDEEVAEELKDHVMIVGMNTLGRRLAVDLTKMGELVLAVDTDPRKLEKLPCRTLIGDAQYLSVLHEARHPLAKLVISTLRIEETNNLIAFRCREAGVPSSIHAFDRSVVEDLRALGADHLMFSKDEGIRNIFELLRREGVLPS
jgi:Kef-type K+ transport system membrane component KefB